MNYFFHFPAENFFFSGASALMRVSSAVGASSREFSTGSQDASVPNPYDSPRRPLAVRLHDGSQAFINSGTGRVATTESNATWSK